MMGFQNEDQDSPGKSRKVLAAVLITAAVAAAAAAIYFFSANRQETPLNLLMDYMKLVEKGEYEEMYAMLDEKVTASLKKEDFVQRNSSIYSGIGIDSMKISVTEYDRCKHTVYYSTSMNTKAGKLKFDNTAQFRKGKDGYRLVWNDAVIFPDLEADDTVQVNTEKAIRGRILDRSGQILAENGLAVSVGIVPGKLKDREASIKKIAELLEMDVSVVESKLSASWVRDDYFVPVKTLRKLEENETELDQAEHKRQDQLLDISGVHFRDIYVRQYPLGEAAAHLVGYVQGVTAEDLEEHGGEGYSSDSMIGRSGLESLYEKELRGQDACTIEIVDSERNSKKILKSLALKKGEDVQVTIDAELQKKMYEEFKDDKSCSVAMDPHTGEVLALVSTPSYDTNAMIMGISTEAWTALNEDENQPLLNRFRQTWAPGSSFKPVTALIGLKCGKVDPAEDAGYSGLSWQKDSSWGSYYVTTLHDYSPKNLENALIYSDNIYFAKTALNIGADQMETSLMELGFQQKIPFEISMTESQYSNSEHIDSEIQLADSGYGQGEILVNPLHLACIYTSLLNQGNVVRPILQSQEREFWLDGAFPEENAETVLEALRKVVSSPEGTGNAAARADTDLAGKTGTAEIKTSKEDTTGTELGWFILMTADPEEERPVLLLSMVEDVKGRGGSGYVAEKESALMNWWLERQT